MLDPFRRINLPRKGRRVGLCIVLFEACSAFTHVTACTLALPPYFVARLTEGFNHFVTSIVAPVASGWSGLPDGIRTHWKAPPLHGARQRRTFTTPLESDRSFQVRVRPVLTDQEPSLPQTTERRQSASVCGGSLTRHRVKKDRDSAPGVDWQIHRSGAHGRHPRDATSRAPLRPPASRRGDRARDGALQNSLRRSGCRPSPT